MQAVMLHSGFVINVAAVFMHIAAVLEQARDASLQNYNCSNLIDVEISLPFIAVATKPAAQTLGLQSI